MKLSVTNVALGQHRAGYHYVIGAFGYESRASAYLAKLFASGLKFDSAIADFQDLKVGYGRNANERFLEDNPLTAVKLQSSEFERFVDFVETSLRPILSNSDVPATIHLDYTCMPRTWYSRLVCRILEKLRPSDALQLWYTPGIYNDRAFAPSGIDDFDVFSGQASLNPQQRVHVLGLGFESVRARAILSVLDPEQLICYFADPGVNQDYSLRAAQENADIIEAADQSVRMPLNDFADAYARLRSVAIDYRYIGDVILIPDGPKPFVLISSILPLTIRQPGVVCLHVRRKAKGAGHAMDVTASGPLVGGEIRRIGGVDHG